MEPAAGVVFALDGVFIGAGDVSFLRTLTLISTIGIYIPIDLVALGWHWGIQGLWMGLFASVVVRLVGVLIHTKRGKWAIAGVEL